MRSRSCVVGENAKAQNGVYVTTTSRTGETVQAKQVPFKTQKVRGGNQPYAHRNAGKQFVLDTVKEYSVRMGCRVNGIVHNHILVSCFLHYEVNLQPAEKSVALARPRPLSRNFVPVRDKIWFDPVRFYTTQ